MSRVYIGIDPGRFGGIAVIKCVLNGTPHIKAYPMPLGVDGDVNPRLVWEMLMEITAGVIKNTTVFIEKTNAVYGASSKSAYSFGRQVMASEAPVICLGLSYETVQPKAWMKQILVGYPKQDKKDKPSLRYVAKKYPNINLIPAGCRVPKDGLSDAICIAEYGYWKLTH